MTYIQAIVFIAYFAFLYARFKRLLPSISISWYMLKKLNFLFTLFCLGIGVPMLFQTNGISPFFFISGAAFITVGAATMFLSAGFTRTLHFLSALIGITSALVGIWFERGIWYPLAVWIPIMVLFELTKPKNKTMWQEIVSFACIITGLL